MLNAANIYLFGNKLTKCKYIETSFLVVLESINVLQAV